MLGGSDEAGSIYALLRCFNPSQVFTEIYVCIQSPRKQAWKLPKKLCFLGELMKALSLFAARQGSMLLVLHVLPEFRYSVLQ